MTVKIYDSRIIANRLIYIAQNHGRMFTAMQINKLVYISHGWMLGLYNRSLITDDIEAWQFGPIIPKLYEALREYGGRHIDGVIDVEPSTIDPQVDDLLQQIFDIYGDLSGPTLSRITSNDNTPYDITCKMGGLGQVISTDIICDHYQHLSRQTSSIKGKYHES